MIEVDAIRGSFQYSDEVLLFLSKRGGTNIDMYWLGAEDYYFFVDPFTLCVQSTHVNSELVDRLNCYIIEDGEPVWINKPSVIEGPNPTARDIMISINEKFIREVLDNAGVPDYNGYWFKKRSEFDDIMKSIYDLEFNTDLTWSKNS